MRERGRGEVEERVRGDVSEREHDTRDLRGREREVRGGEGGEGGIR